MTIKSVLDDGVFPILGWAGPGGGMIRQDVMSGMAEAGFTVSHSAVSGDEKQVLAALDVAAKAGIRLLVVHNDWHVGDNYIFDAEQKNKVRSLIKAIQNHPGLYGYHLRDEPRFHMLPLLTEVQNFVRELDPYHLCYINHFPPIEGWGAPTAEAFWVRYIQQAKPQMLSYDHYPVMIGTDAEIAAQTGLPNVFPQDKLIIKPDYFSTLELLRNLSNYHQIPFWAFTCSVRHGPYPTPTEGHIRFQLMNDLAYGAKGLQYFTYAHDNAMVNPDGSTTETWQIARKVNREIHALAPVISQLQNIGVFHTGTLWSGTQALHRSQFTPLVDCEGDPATLGLFQDAKENVYIFVVNGSPCAWAKLRLKVHTGAEKDKLFFYHIGEKAFRELWPPDIHDQLVTLSPGEGKLFKVGGEGLGQNF